MGRGSTKLASLLGLAVILLASACGGSVPPCKVPSAVELEIESSDRVNRRESGESLPTVVRLYQLKNLSKLQMATFEDVWKRPEESLGSSLLETDELTIFPGQIMVVQTERNSEADYLVGAAIFRNPVGQSWRTIQEWPLAGDPCTEKQDEDAAPRLQQLRVRMFLRDFRIESVNNYKNLAKRRCPPGEQPCSGAGGEAPDELPDAKRRRRLRTFEEDPSAPQPTIGRGTGEP